jgi:hypothetical protein
MRLQESKGRFSLTIPKQYITLLNWDRGTELLVLPDMDKKGTLTIQEMPKKK